ncbi:MAG TPA: hypothetical protein VFA11_14405 [Acidimicrobiales bacterium]|nr:hypothetical protein [Acidimicrobiales bacterium]
MIRKAFTDVDVIGFAESDINPEMARYELAADEHDQKRMAHFRIVAEST